MVPVLAPLLPLLLACADPAPPAVERAPEPAPENRVLHPPDPIAPPETPPGTAPSALGAPRDPAAPSRGGPQAAIARTVQEHEGRIQTCVDVALRHAPDLHGTVALGWTIAGGRVTEAHVVRNTTGEDRLAACMLKAVRLMRFDASVDAEVSEFPWTIVPPK